MKISIDDEIAKKCDLTEAEALQMTYWAAMCTKVHWFNG